MQTDLCRFFFQAFIVDEKNDLPGMEREDSSGAKLVTE